MLRKKLKKRAKKAKNLVPDNLAEHAANLKSLAKKPEDSAPSLENVPRITNETIAVHREEVLKGARKYIYPLQHSKNRIIALTTWILVATLAVFLIYSTLALYRLNQYNTFLYRTSQVVPFPIARIGDNFISYENYLFQLRHYVHYYQTQLGRNFEGSDKQQLIQFRKQALDGVIKDAYVKMLAEQNHVSVSDKEVDARISEVRNQNRLGSNNKVFADVLHDYWGWSVSDFKRSLKQEILAENVVAKLDAADMNRANAALVQAKSGADFGQLASQLSDDPNAKVNGGDYGKAITKTDPNVPPQVVDALFKLQPGQISGVINTGSTLEIVKVIQVNGNAVVAKHIVFNLKDISTYTKPLKDKNPAHTFVKF
jgi:hypothetical protein